jgi:hypothetical protein
MTVALADTLQFRVVAHLIWSFPRGQILAYLGERHKTILSQKKPVYGFRMNLSQRENSVKTANSEFFSQFIKHILILTEI